jgi:general secretion pathway protein M
MKLSIQSRFKQQLSGLRSAFEKLALREQRLVIVMVVTLLLALTWQWGLAPAWRLWRSAPALHAQLDRELVHMQSLAEEAHALQSTPTKTAAESLVWLNASLKNLGKATLTQQGQRVQVNFNQATPEQLASWLSSARTSAALLPLEARWKRQTEAKAVLWDGVVVFEMRP